MDFSKAAVCTSLGSVLLLILASCQNYVVDDSFEKAKGTELDEPEKNNKLNGSAIEVLSDDVQQDEVSRQDNSLLPTVAPATPVSSSFILVSPSTGGESPHQSIPIEHGPDQHESITHKGRPSENSQIDEVEFIPDLLVKKDLENLPPSYEVKMIKEPVKLKAEDSIDDNGGSLEFKLKDHDESHIDIMKFEAKDKDSIVDKNEKDIKANYSTTLNAESPKKEDTDLQLDKDATSIDMLELKDTTTSESDVQDKGILESFNDWKEKQGTTGKKDEFEKSINRGSVKKRGNKKTNYASSECGAKVIATNPEAENVGAILNENRDFYMLNPCSCSIWFVIELCEKVRVETIEIANFELFSSTMEKFNAFFSTRYPTREWENGGLFHGKAERTIQSYNMAEEYYAKFVKVEVLSHFGKEHYCPLSLVRVFGRSEVEELDDSEDPSTEHDTVHVDSETDSKMTHNEMHAEAKNSAVDIEKQNFLKSAKDMVIGLVNKATQSFTGSNDKVNDTNSMENANKSLNASEKFSDNKMQTNDSGSHNVLPTVIHINDENQDDSEPMPVTSESDSSPVEGKEAPTDSSSGVSTSVPPNLVILLDGDDGEEETEASSHSKLCIFRGEIELNRCANPKVKFWVEYLFTLRMCPVSSNSLLNGKKISSHETLNETKNVDGNSSFTVDTFNISTIEEKSQLGEVATHHQMVVDATTFNEANNVAHGTSCHSHSSSVDDFSNSKEEESKVKKLPFANPLTSGQQVEGFQGVTAAELIKQKTSEEMGACKERLPSQPDLSQLLNEAISRKNAAYQVEKKTTTESSVVIAASRSTYEPEDTSPEEKTKAGHVDVLVINYDEHFWEGKAEIPVDIIKKEPLESDNKLLNADSKNKGRDIVDSSYEKIGKEKEIPASSVEELMPKVSTQKPLESSSSSAFSFKEMTLVADNGGEKVKIVDGISEEPRKISQSVDMLKKEEVEPHSIISKEGEKTVNTSFIRIEPSFSEPPTGSLEAHETPANHETIKVSITNSGIGTSLRPASVSRSSSFTENYVLSATVPAGEAEMKDQVIVSHEKAPGDAESPSASVEQFAKQKMEAMEALTQLESPVKIGSGSSGNNKESAILKLKSRVKELASNLSLSTLYLEEMSKRYGTALEEQQKQFKAKISLLNQTVARNREVIDKQRESIEELTKQVVLLTMRLQNLTEATREQNLQMAERYAFTCMIEAFIIIIVLYTCIRGPRAVQQEQTEHRRHSAPSVYNHLVDHGNERVFHLRSDNLVADQRPSDHGILNHLEKNIPVNQAYSAIVKRKRQRRKRFSDGSLYPELGQSDMRAAKEAAVISSKAGVLFSAGKGIFSGITGAFSKQKKVIASRQTRALIDSTEDERVKSLGRSKSLSTIGEDDILIPPHRHKSLENIPSSKCRRALSRLSDSDKRRA